MLHLWDILSLIYFYFGETFRVSILISSGLHYDNMLTIHILIVFRWGNDVLDTCQILSEG